MPVVKAIGLLPRERMEALWRIVRSRPSERAVVDGVIAQLEACGAIDACIAQSHELVESAYAALQPLIPDSFAKIMLRAFGWFVTEQAAPRDPAVLLHRPPPAATAQA
jgi:geranylgeranyl pyrophosphate synthase